MSKTAEEKWPDEVRLKMIEKSEFYSEPKIYQYGFYDGYQLALNSQWVSVKERLPEYLQTVIIHSKTGFVTQAQFGGGKRPMFSVGNQEWIEADFWQNQPSPPLNH